MMVENKIEVFCDCGEILGIKDLDTKVITLKENIPFLVQDLEYTVPTVVCKCAYCKETNFIRGKIV